jgi:hypothetical protein
MGIPHIDKIEYPLWIASTVVGVSPKAYCTDNNQVTVPN